jgi:colanic acid/amylovoran biosynthesis glycosyltransferase
LKIAYFLNDFPSYSQTFVLHQIVGMIELGHQVRIYARRKNDLDTLPKAVVYHRLLEKTVCWEKVPNNRLVRVAKLFQHISALPKNSKAWRILSAFNFLKFGKQALSLKLAYDALPFLSDDDFDIIHCQFGMLGPIAISLRQAGIIKGSVVTSFRGYDTDQYLRQFPDAYNNLFSKGDLFLPVQSQFATWLQTQSVPPEKIRVLRSGIDCKQLPFSERQVDQGRPIRLISVARLVVKKGLRYAIQAVANVMQHGYLIHYDIIGDGPLADDLTSLIHQLSLEEQVHLRGWMRHDLVLDHMQKAHLLLAPSITAEDGDKEGIPNVIKEAMALGLPVLSTWHSGIPELITDGVTGFLVPEKDATALVTSLLDYLQTPEKWTRLAKKGRIKIDAEYNIDHLNRELEMIYKTLLTAVDN